ncbi:MAG TPA: hypothetical protein DIC56_01340 [Rhizobium sp.]|nr:hypothetical protein [Rhizobium sp.]
MKPAAAHIVSPDGQIDALAITVSLYALILRMTSLDSAMGYPQNAQADNKPDIYPAFSDFENPKNLCYK